MNFKKISSFCIASILGFCLFTAGSSAYEINLDKINGSNRFSASRMMSKYFDSAEPVVISSGQDYPDVLSTSSLSSNLSSPILLTSDKTTNGEIIEYIIANNIKNITSMGGPNPINSKVLEAYKNKKDYKTPEFKNNNFVQAKVVKVVDGDTISVNISGKVYKLRMVGVDTPETLHPKKPVQYYGKEASNYTKSQLTGKSVYLQKDVTDTDKYGRLLRYIWIQKPSSNNPSKNEVTSMMYNAQLVKNGYGQVYTYPPDVKYIPIFKELESVAKKNNIGLWKKSTTNPKPIEKPKSTARPNISLKPKHTQVGTQGKGLVRGNKRTKIYHIPGDRYYNKINPKNTIYFGSPQEAEFAGYRHSKV